MTAREIVRALGGRGHSARCPAHKDRDPSLSVHDGPGGKLLVHCHAGCDQLAVWQALKDLGLVGDQGHLTAVPFRPPQVETDTSEPDRRAKALAFWEASVPAINTPAQDYLRGRGIVIQPPPCIRYHREKNALVALIQAADGVFTGIQRIYLTTDSSDPKKQGCYSLGPIRGGAVRLTPAGDPLQLCESIEDGLALLQMSGKATWAVPGSTFIPGFEPPKSVRDIVLAPDNDSAGLDAIKKAAESLAKLQVKVRQLLPPSGQDWCDVLESREDLAIRNEDGTSRTWVEEFLDG